MRLSTMQIFKYLPAAKKTEFANCKSCGFPTCMAFALKLSGAKTTIEACPHICEELKNIYEESVKIQQETVVLGDIKIGGETVMFRHDKTFVNKTLLAVNIDCNCDFDKTFERLKKYRIERVGDEFKIQALLLENINEKCVKKAKEAGFEILNEVVEKLKEVEDGPIPKLIDKLTILRRKAIIEKDPDFSKPLMIHLKDEDIYSLCAKASMIICKYANVIVFDEFDEALFSVLNTLIQNIYTDPEKPLKVESKVYEINNPNENSNVFMTTNFALSYFAVFNELDSLSDGSYLIATPSEGLSVLTAYSAETLTAKIAAKFINESDVLQKVKNKRLIIPGLLADLKPELEHFLPDWEIIPGTIEAYQLPEFIKELKKTVVS